MPKRSSIRPRSRITKVILLSPLILVLILALNIVGVLAYFTDSIVLSNIFTISSTHEVTYRYYIVDENEASSTFQNSKLKTYFNGQSITLGNDSEYFIDDSEKYENVIYKVGDISITNPYTMPNRNVTIDQYYYLKRYRLDYNLDGGQVTSANPTMYTEETETFTLNNPEKEGYTFDGWTWEGNTTPEKTVTITKGNK